MTDPISVDRCWGRPRFDDPSVRQVQQSEGDLAAWRALLTRTDSDIETRRAVASVAGSFAFGLTLPDGRKVLAVDRFAVCTLAFRQAGDAQAQPLTFAPEADRLADASTPLDVQSIYDYLHFHAIASPRTVFEGVQRLPPAHCLIRSSLGRQEVGCYWTPQFAPEAESFDRRRATFLELVERAVADAVEDGEPVGCFLSGGTDSSTVAGMLTRVLGRPADAYSIGFAAEGYDEMAYARLAAKHFGVRHHEYYVTPEDLVRDIPKLAAALDQPFGNSSLLPTHCCAVRAREDGVRRLLAGDGGDELFGGNARYAKQKVFGWYALLPPSLRRGVMEPLLASSNAARTALTRKAASYVEQARVPMPARLEMYNLLLRLGVDSVLSPGFLARIDRQAPLHLQQSVWNSVADADPLDRQLAFDWRFTLAESDLPKVRTATRAAGVEVAYPLLDERLLQFSLRLPSRDKLRGLKLRWFFKEALRGFLPAEILTKKKHGFGLPFGTWVVSHPGLRQLATQSLEGIARRGVVNPMFVRELLGRRLAEHPGYYGEMVWILMMLEQWLKHHRDGFRIEA